MISPLDKLNPVVPADQSPLTNDQTPVTHDAPQAPMTHDEGPTTNAESPLTNDSSPALFPARLTTTGLALPFTPEPGGLLDSARAFYQSLRTRFVGGFLALKRVIRSPV